jgi:hypothetical protein
MEQVHDIIEAINEKVHEYVGRTGVAPTRIAISPGLYRRLLEFTAWVGRIGNLIIGCAPITEFETSSGKLRLVIDELIPDMNIEITDESTSVL